MLLYACFGVMPWVITACMAATRAASPPPMLEERTRWDPLLPMLCRTWNMPAAVGRRWLSLARDHVNGCARGRLHAGSCQYMRRWSYSQRKRASIWLRAKL